MKRCPKCETEKPDSEFYPTKTGLRVYCKECVKMLSNDYYKKNPEKYKQYNFIYRAQPHRQEANRKQCHEWYLRNKSKKHCHYLLQSAIKSGKIKRGFCEVYGSPFVLGHHDDYSKPLEVRWLCREHHNKLHFAKENVENHGRK